MSCVDWAARDCSSSALKLASSVSSSLIRSSFSVAMAALRAVIFVGAFGVGDFGGAFGVDDFDGAFLGVDFGDAFGVEDFNFGFDFDDDDDDDDDDEDMDMEEEAVAPEAFLGILLKNLPAASREAVRFLVSSAMADEPDDSGDSDGREESMILVRARMLFQLKRLGKLKLGRELSSRPRRDP